MTENKNNSTFNPIKLLDNLISLKNALTIQDNKNVKPNTIKPIDNKTNEILIEDKTKFKTDGL
jgi:hypothetical protein